MDKGLLDLYTDYLISSFSQTTATGLSRLLDGLITHDRVTNFLAESTLTSKDLWLLVKQDVRQVQTDDAAIIFDDTVEEKPYSGGAKQVMIFSRRGIARVIEGMATDEFYSMFNQNPCQTSIFGKVTEKFHKELMP